MRKCPTCKRRIPDPSERAADSAGAAEGPPLPFCSQRCKLADLHGWLSGKYVVSDALPFGDSDALPGGEDE